MKPLLPILLSLLISTTVFCQSAVDSFFNIKMQKPPENWVELIQQNEWSPYCYVDMKRNKIERIERVSIDVPIMFDSTKMIVRGKKLISSVDNLYVDSLYALDIAYFPKQRIYCYKNNGLVCRVIDVSNGYVSLEDIESMHFNHETGKVGSHWLRSKNKRTIFIYKKIQP